MSSKPKRWSPPSAAPLLGRYSHVAEVPENHRLVYLSGQVGNTSEGDVPDNAYDQVLQAFQNLESLLEALDASPANIVRLLSFVKGEENLEGYFEARNEVYADWFPDGDWPGHTLAVVVGLARSDLLAEIEGWIALPLFDA